MPLFVSAPPTVPPHKLRRLAVFVDGENLTRRIIDIEKVVRPRYTPHSPHEAVFLREGAHAYWPCILSSGAGWNDGALGDLVRVSYYTSVLGGDHQRLVQTRQALQDAGVGETFVALREKDRSKGVDIQMAVDIMSAVASRQCDDIVLVSADRDFAPVVRAAKRQGARVFLSFPGFQCLGDSCVEDQAGLKKAMSLAPGTEFLLEFDGVVRQTKWLEFVPLSQAEVDSYVDPFLKPALLTLLRVLGATPSEEPSRTDANTIGAKDYLVRLLPDTKVCGWTSRGGGRQIIVPLFPLTDFVDRFGQAAAEQWPAAAP